MLPAAPSRARVRAWFAALAVGVLALLALVVPAGAAHAADDDGLVLVAVNARKVRYAVDKVRTATR